MPPVDKSLTVPVLNSFSSAKKRLLLRELSGAFQTTHQQSKWNDEVAEQCRWCGEPEDTRVHRMFTCKAFHAIREPFQEIVSHFLDVGAMVAGNLQTSPL